MQPAFSPIPSLNLTHFATFYTILRFPRGDCKAQAAQAKFDLQVHCVVPELAQARLVNGDRKDYLQSLVEASCNRQACQQVALS